MKSRLEALKCELLTAADAVIYPEAIFSTFLAFASTFFGARGESFRKGIRLKSMASAFMANLHAKKLTAGPPLVPA